MKRLTCAGSALLFFIPVLALARQKYSDEALQLKVLQAQRLIYRVYTGQSSRANCSIAGLGDSATMNCTSAPNPVNGTPHLLYAALVIGTNGNGYVISCDQGTLTPEACPLLSTGTILSATLKGGEMVVDMYAHEIAYKVVTSTYLGYSSFAGEDEHRSAAGRLVHAVIGQKAQEAAPQPVPAPAPPVYNQDILDVAARARKLDQQSDAARQASIEQAQATAQKAKIQADALQKAQSLTEELLKAQTPEEQQKIITQIGYYEAIAQSGEPGTAVVIPSGQAGTVAATTSPGKGTVAVTSTPQGGEIYVDGKFMGDTPSTLDLQAGSHDIEVRLAGRPSWKRTLEVTKGSKVTLQATLGARN
ncbi:MAG TPA: PEGA domain-containing protein [Terriglobia bacterium]|nr:PEGA domain-containing protein [Terriglobia bacterium]